MLTILQKKIAQSIVNIFETGEPLGDYGNVTVLNGDTGHLTYGRSQTTLASGNLALLLHGTVYRMDALMKLIEAGKWDLPLPLTVRNVIISEDILSPEYEPPVIVSAGDTDERVLFYTRPLMRGDDVRRLQLALGFTEKETDGVFGRATEQAVKDFQNAHGLIPDGKVGTATRAALIL